MRIGAARAWFLDGGNRSVPDRKFYFDLVDALFSTPKSIFSATVAALLLIVISWALTGDVIYLLFVLAFLFVGIGRSTTVYRYHHTPHDKNDLAAIKRWENCALIGAWSFSGLVGLIGAYTLIVQGGTEVEILISCGVIGYIAGISSRNASRPIITIGQISFTCIPFTFALFLRADVVHVSLAIFIAVLYLSTIVMCRSVFDTILSRHEAFKKIETLAQRDSLTGLWNRAAFLQMLEQNLKTARKVQKNLALISIDLDRFKDINDTLGHPAGDSVLREVSERIRLASNPEDEISRIGGDEFLIMIMGADNADVYFRSRRLLAEFSRPFTVNMTKSRCGASIGYAVAPGDGAMLDTLLRNADLALYEAKKRGRGQIVPYTEVLSQQYDNRIALERDLNLAIGSDQFEVEYQPVVDPRSGRAIRCEALLRWRHPQLGRVPPSDFIPIAEATGLIIPIGSWVLKTACEEATRWSSDINVSVNLSPVQFRRGREIVDIVMAALTSTGLAPCRLNLEVTETVLIEDTSETLAILNELRAKGVGISLDDFGTGFASLSYLNDFPFSEVKIDRKFSQNIDQSPRTAAIIKGIAQTTRDLRIELVAEGVETEVQLERMRAFGINAIQGYLFSPSLPVEELRRVISRPIVPKLADKEQGARVLELDGARRAASAR